MSEVKSQVRDRVLILRVLVPSLEVRLRDKMEEAAAANNPAASSTNNTSSSSGADFSSVREVLADLEGVTCEPTTDMSGTKWVFICDGASYPTRLVNLPLPVELHKTQNHAMYYKCANVAQMLIVYEDEMALEEADDTPLPEYPSYYPSGLTPPMHNVVEKRFSRREHKAVPPPRTQVRETEEELRQLMEQFAVSSKKTKAKSPAQAKVISEIVEDIVDYEPWMDDYGAQPNGVEFDADDKRCTKHPQIWLDVEEVDAIRQAERELQERKAQAAAKKEQKKAPKKKKTKKKAVAPEESMDDVTNAAMMLASGDDVDLLGDFGEFDSTDILGLDMDEEMDFSLDL